MTKSEKAKRKYYFQVRSMLPCSRKMKNAIMNQIQDSVDAYTSENPAADYEQITSLFGVPESIAAAYIESTGTAEILKSMRIRRKIFGILAAVLVAALLAWSCYLICGAVQVNNILKSLDGSYDDSYIVEGTVEIDPQGTDCVFYAP